MSADLIWIFAVAFAGGLFGAFFGSLGAHFVLDAVIPFFVFDKDGRPRKD